MYSQGSESMISGEDSHNPFEESKGVKFFLDEEIGGRTVGTTKDRVKHEPEMVDKEPTYQLIQDNNGAFKQIIQ